MSRWWGSYKDAEDQAAERNRRQASRNIKGLDIPVVSSDEGEYRDCDTSGLGIPNLDGNVSEDNGSSTSQNSGPTQPVVMPHCQVTWQLPSSTTFALATSPCSQSAANGWSLWSQKLPDSLRQRLSRKNCHPLRRRCCRTRTSWRSWSTW